MINLATLNDLEKAELELAEEFKKYYGDILGVVLFMYPWNKYGTVLHGMNGPSREQARFLDDLSDEIKVRGFDGIHPVESIEMAVSSGHGGGKTEMIGMVAPALMVTRDGMRGTVTANSGDQLRNKTWASIQKYKKLMICSHWYDITSEKFWRIGRKEDWCINAVTWKEENADAFQGQHAARSTSLYIFDEDSNIPDSIHIAAEGGTVHGEAMVFRFGNCTRRSGNFYNRCFGSGREALIRKTKGPSRGTDHPASLRRWDTSKTEIRNDIRVQEIIEEYGEESDYYRVRVAGLPPNASDIQFIPQDWIEAAARRPVSIQMMDQPILAGVDLSWGGDDPATIRFRCGTDARSVAKISVPGEMTRDPDVMVMKCAEALDARYPIWGNRKIDMMFFDHAGTCGNICQRLRDMGHENVREINFGGHAPNKKYKLMRSYMIGQVKENLQYLAIDTSPDLAADMGTPGYTITPLSEILLEPKQAIIKRLGHSTDDLDALALTYAMPVKIKSVELQKQAAMAREREMMVERTSSNGGWMR